MTKKDSTSTSPSIELIDIPALMKLFKIGKALVVKEFETAKLEPVHKMAQGKGFSMIYDAHKAKEILQKFVDQRAAAKTARETLAAERLAKKQKKSESQAELPLHQTTTVFDQSVLDPLKVQLREFSDKVYRSQEMNNMQFKLLDTGIKMLEQRMEGLSNTLSSLEHMLTDFLTTPTSQLPPAPVFVTAPATAATPAPASDSQEEANKEQQFFQGTAPTSVVDTPTPTTTGKTLTLKTKGVSRSSGISKGSGEPSNTNGVADAKHVCQSKVAQNAGVKSKPKVLIIGLHDNKVRHFNDFQNIMELTIVNPDDAKIMSRQTFPTADYTLFMTGFISHAASTDIAKGSKEILVRGGNTRLRHALANIALQHNLQ